MRLPLPFLAAVIFADPCLAQAAPPAAIPKPAEQLYGVYLSRDYFALEKQLGSLDSHDSCRGFFEGQLDAAFLHDEQAETKLRHFVALCDMPADWRREAWYTLARTEMLRGDYDAAASDSARALEEPSTHFGPGERAAIEALLKISRALHGVPPQSRSDHSGASTVNAFWNTSDALHGGCVYVDYHVNGLTEAALLDTDATLSVVSESFAQAHRLHLLPVQTSVTASTGHVVSARLGVADEVQIGQMCFQHVVFFVLKDADLVFSSHTSINSFIGLPLIFALGHLRVSFGEDRMEIGLPSNPDPAIPVPERNLAFNRTNLLARLQYQGNDLPFLLDTGDTDTQLYDRFGQRFPQALLGSVGSSHRTAGAGGSMMITTPTLPQLELGVDNRSILLHDIRVQSQPSSLPAVVGRVGGDLLSGGYDLDFHQMHFSVLGRPQPSPAVSTSP